MITVLYDGHCVICRQSKRIISTFDWLGRVRFQDVHDWETVSQEYPQLDFQTAMGQMHVVAQDGVLVGGFGAVHRLLRDLPLGWALWLILHLPGMGYAGERLYRFVARHRYRVNRFFGVECDAEGCKISP